MIKLTELKKQLHWGVVFFLFFALLIIILTLGLSSIISRDTEQSKVLAYPLVTTDDPFAGNPEAKVHIVEFSDFQCPFCQKSSSIVRDIIQSYGDRIHFVYRDFPLASHRYAKKAGEAGECAQDQDKFWGFHDEIFANQDKIGDIKKIAMGVPGLDMIKFNKCLDSNKYKQEVLDDYADGLSAGVDGTPTFFINGEIVAGAVPRKTLIDIIEKYLNN